jgi:hypothetical protein
LTGEPVALVKLILLLTEPWFNGALKENFITGLTEILYLAATPVRLSTAIDFENKGEGDGGGTGVGSDDFLQPVTTTPVKKNNVDIHFIIVTVYLF